MSPSIHSATGTHQPHKPSPSKPKAKPHFDPDVQAIRGIRHISIPLSAVHVCFDRTLEDLLLSVQGSHQPPATSPPSLPPSLARALTTRYQTNGHLGSPSLASISVKLRRRFALLETGTTNGEVCSLRYSTRCIWWLCFQLNPVGILRRFNPGRLCRQRPALIPSSPQRQSIFVPGNASG
ncbi:hypothetical protein MPTK1_1g27030 [Marchantia polymorpha subsp. ruderalis]|uniref:Uncharacterized protein n=2 Tax=Marchantia polymorpha TaxID=3197 RepID=A0AAF6AUQ8_MARPO|nr:hypothetical protein MARPO_0002s0175 [Marchantia polymorpha]BBN00179.1 hypothetical protein Mp_1g27030 [Marchantia polymorpha subsp. ruderalis]|eukprot:PTQ49705.1 hypothetical protein MARPO_0002s0175 [Marchantia polymorpha]